MNSQGLGYGVNGTPGVEAILSRMSAGFSAARYLRDEVVYSQGDPADSAFYVRSGKVKVLVVSEAGKGAVVGLLASGSFFGEECLSGRVLRLTTVRAFTDCDVVRIEKGCIARALRDDQQFTQLFLSDLVERHIGMRENLADQLLSSTEKRLARMLLILANYGKEDESAPILPKINQETLAEMIGTSRTHVNFFMKKFRQLGLIEYNGEIKINRPLLNLVLQEKPRIESPE